MKISRRNFIKTAGAASVFFPTIIPASVLGADAPSKKINIALVGCGRRGREICGTAFSQPNARIAGLCDPKGWCTDECKKLFARDNPKVYRSYIDVINSPEIDALLIATMDHWHVPIAIQAARKGKHVYVEKPLSISLDKSQILRKAVNDSAVVFQYGAQQRSDPCFRRAVELVRNGYIGNLKLTTSVCPDFLGTEAAPNALPDEKNSGPIPENFDYDMWTGASQMMPYSLRRTSRYAFHIYNYSLGYVGGWGAHPINIVQWALNMDNSGPVSVESGGSIPVNSMFDTINHWDADIRYANGQKYRFMSHSEFNKKPVKELRGYQVLFEGDDGFIKVTRNKIAYSSEKLANVKLKGSDWRAHEDDSNHMRAFINCIKTNREAINPVEAAIRSDEVSMLVNVAVRSKSRVEWDPKTETAKDPQQQAMMTRKNFRPEWDVI